MEGGLRTLGVSKTSTPTEPLMSVITVVYNGAPHIERAIESVLMQCYSNLEFIIIDGCSSDGTVEIIKSYGNKIDYWVSEPDNGIYDAMNKGIVFSKGDLIGFLNSDDYYEPESIIEVIAAYNNTGCRAIFFGNSFVAQEDLGIRYLAMAKPTLWRGLGFKHQAMFVHRDIYKRFGLYNIAYRIAADYDFVLNAVLRGARLIYINKNLVNYSNTGISGINRMETMNEIRVIGMRHYGFFSLRHFGFLIVFARSYLFQVVGKLIELAFGSKALLKVRSTYMKIRLKST